MEKVQIQRNISRCAFDALLMRNVLLIHENIFFNLDYKSCKECLEVSNAWNELLTSAPFLKKGWYWCPIVVSKLPKCIKNPSKMYPKTIQIPKCLQNVTKMSPKTLQNQNVSKKSPTFFQKLSKECPKS